jgi:energy-coupling factor transporter ATP-binding protein EcfA2
MKIHRLEINNIRGIRNLILEPKGKTLAIHGPNGSGKSAVVDAIDFLLTGNISRLRGRGTGGITVSRYGGHVDTTNPEDVWVLAELELPSGDITSVKRCLAHHGSFECEDTHRPIVESLMAIAKDGQHILCRRDIQRYITAEKGQRGRALQALLKIAQIDTIRKNLITLHNSMKRRLDDTSEDLDREKGRVCEIGDIQEYDENLLLDYVNKQRLKLNGSPIKETKSNMIKEKIKPPSQRSDNVIDKKIVQEELTDLHDYLSQKQLETLISHQDGLRSGITSLNEDSDLKQNYDVMALVKQGLDKLDETGACPLCKHPWPEGRLQEILEERLSGAKRADKIHNRIESSLKNLQIVAAELTSKIRGILDNFEKAKLKSEAKFLKGMLTRIEKLHEMLSTSDITTLDESTVASFSVLFEELCSSNAFSLLSKYINGIPDETTEVQSAWDILTRIEVQIKDVEEMITRAVSLQKAFAITSTLNTSFLSARDEVVGSLLADVRDRFVNLYCTIHGDDESDFSATLELDGPSCEFLVDFYGRNQHPPHALHSEGHQDSMGLCLYLAIAEKLGGDQIHLVVLDDVMMSIDRNHRRGVLEIIRSAFPNQQFLITTHDKTWSYQLKYGLSLDKRTFVQFSGWSIDLGPRIETHENIWAQVNEIIDEDEVSKAAPLLRRWLEEFLDTVCARLAARTKHRQDGHYELGNLISAARSQYKELLKQGNKSARSWENEAEREKLDEIDSVRKQIEQRISSEYWAINAAVHFNEWDNFSASDFRPVVEAFEDFCAQFVCSQCGSFLSLVAHDYEETAVGCNCGSSGWNLKTKPD